MSNNKTRDTSYGENINLSLIDKFGIYLSEIIIKKTIKKLKEKNIELLDLGCGYNAIILKKVVPIITKGVGVDLSINKEIKTLPKLQFFEGKIEEVIKNFQNESFHLILMNSVLEHLWEPIYILNECRRILKKDGMLLINVPTWTGKFFLETSAFTFKLSP
ncbi:MAG: class I SAM-dependent methyltransferase, partial [Candidatus Eremiobacterota bacterium]